MGILYLSMVCSSLCQLISYLNPELSAPDSWAIAVFFPLVSGKTSKFSYKDSKAGRLGFFPSLP